jgi:hypothetical protein
MYKALCTGIVICLITLFSLSVFWALELNREPVLYQEPGYLTLEVKDTPLLTDAAKREAKETGRAWFCRSGELVIMENVPEQYLED